MKIRMGSIVWWHGEIKARVVGVEPDMMKSEGGAIVLSIQDDDPRELRVITSPKAVTFRPND